MFSSIIIFIIVLSILVLVHELGHFMVAKKAGIWVEEFGFGIPPRVFGKKIGETIYSLNLFPFGGFVRLHGENSDENLSKPKRAFMSKSKKTRALIVTAGVIMNFVLAFIAFAVVYTVNGIPRDTNYVKIIEIAQDSPAIKAGLVVGDTILKVNEVQVGTNDEFVGEVAKNAGREVNFTIKKAGSEEVESLKINPRENPPEGEGALGVVISTIEVYFPPIWQRPFLGIYYGFQEAVFWTGIILGGLYSMIKGLFGGLIPKDVAGPVGIYALTSQAASFGLMSLINFIGVLSVNLAILNVLPFPALDGGRLLFIFLEKFLGKRVLPKVENVIHAVGMVLLLLLMVAITFSDIRKLIAAGSIAGFIENVMK